MQSVHHEVDRLLDKLGAATTIGHSIRSLDRLTAPRGPIPSIRIGSRVMFDPNDLRAFIDSRRVVGVADAQV